MQVENRFNAFTPSRITPEELTQAKDAVEKATQEVNAYEQDYLLRVAEGEKMGIPSGQMSKELFESFKFKATDIVDDRRFFIG